MLIKIDLLSSPLHIQKSSIENRVLSVEETGIGRLDTPFLQLGYVGLVELVLLTPAPVFVYLTHCFSLSLSLLLDAFATAASILEKGSAQRGERCQFQDSRLFIIIKMQIHTHTELTQRMHSLQTIPLRDILQHTVEGKDKSISFRAWSSVQEAQLQHFRPSA